MVMVMNMMMMALFDKSDMELPCRWMMLIAQISIIGSILFNIYHSKLERSLSTFYNPREHILVFLFIRGSFFAATTASVMYAICPQDYWIPAFEAFHYYLSLHPLMIYTRLLVGSFIHLSGILFLHLTLQTLGHNYSTSLNIRRDHHLITYGPYRYVRHPMYTSMYLVIIGMFIISCDIFFIITSSIAMFGIMFLRTPQEEEMMLEHFGKIYEEYMTRTNKVVLTPTQLFDSLVNCSPSKREE